mmetsp:Transcript_7193/g.24891  ORF Transcript_7193/g.24891 Transcript_7193/m.24891 type:complete len:294 (+) Transcript_7193:613-1494(+)
MVDVDVDPNTEHRACHVDQPPAPEPERKRPHRAPEGPPVVSGGGGRSARDQDARGAYDRGPPRRLPKAHAENPPRQLKSPPRRPPKERQHPLHRIERDHRRKVREVCARKERAKPDRVDDSVPHPRSECPGYGLHARVVVARARLRRDVAVEDAVLRQQLQQRVCQGPRGGSRSHSRAVARYLPEHPLHPRAPERQPDGESHGSRQEGGLDPAPLGGVGVVEARGGEALSLADHPAGGRCIPRLGKFLGLDHRHPRAVDVSILWDPRCWRRRRRWWHGGTPRGRRAPWRRTGS